MKRFLIAVLFCMSLCVYGAEAQSSNAQSSDKDQASLPDAPSAVAERERAAKASQSDSQEVQAPTPGTDEYSTSKPKGPSSVRAEMESEKKSNWTKTDTLLELGYASLHITDWGQTLTISRDPRFAEGNPILGPKPPRGKVNVYFAGTLVGHVLVSRLLPRKPRRVFQILTIGIEGFVVAHNFKHGVKPSH
ncbi:MAG: hypothetical protein Q7R94_01055 [bacterium]|nr:hypothetical protein [bacterium]